MFCFQSKQNRTINEEFDFCAVKGVGVRGTRFKKIEKASYRTVVLTHTDNFSIKAQLERVHKSGTFGGFLGPTREGGDPIIKI